MKSTIEIFYVKEYGKFLYENLSLLFNNFDSELFDFKKSHELVETTYKDIGVQTYSDILESIFYFYNWIDNDPEEFQFIGTDHSSMSVGDIVGINEEYYICAFIGWKKINSVKEGE